VPALKIKWSADLSDTEAGAREGALIDKGKVCALIVRHKKAEKKEINKWSMAKRYQISHGTAIIEL
jgi:hypothetical protein